MGLFTLATNAQTWVVEVIQRFADQGHPEHCQNDGRTREDSCPPNTRSDIGNGPVEVITPLRSRGWLDTEANKAQAGKRENGFSSIESKNQRQSTGRVFEDMHNHHAPMRCADHKCGF